MVKKTKHKVNTRLSLLSGLTVTDSRSAKPELKASTTAYQVDANTGGSRPLIRYEIDESLIH